MKKSLLKTALSWLTRQPEEQEKLPDLATPSEEKYPPVSIVVEPPSPPSIVPERAPPPSVRRVRRMEISSVPAPVDASVAPVSANEGPALKLVKRGAALYGICPHCEAHWNVRERLSVVSFKKVEKTLTCPSCNQPVSLPQTK